MVRLMSMREQQLAKHRKCMTVSTNDHTKNPRIWWGVWTLLASSNSFNVCFPIFLTLLTLCCTSQQQVPYLLNNAHKLIQKLLRCTRGIHCNCIYVYPTTSLAVFFSSPFHLIFPSTLHMYWSLFYADFCSILFSTPYQSLSIPSTSY